MEKEIKWRFPGNGGTKKNGLDTADFHTFMDDREASLAREICQNSNDALRKNADGPAKVEFHLFDMKVSDIPHVEELKEELARCYDCWKDDNNDIGDRVQQMIDLLEGERIKCLRISDFNTTGLNGVLDYDDEKSLWYSLLHGSGASSKNEQEGGSKGVGKYATFVNSSVRTVFYSTYTEEKKQKGYQGIAYFCSSKVKDSPDGELTQGIGYFGINRKNDAVEGELNLDREFKVRSGNNYGTDIYIIGFRGGDNWKDTILAKVLDSFMVAIARGRLEVQIDGISVNKNTFKSLAMKFASSKTVLSRSVVSQSILLSGDENVHKEKIDIEYDGEVISTVELFYRRFNGEEQSLATNACSMIRYPFMKIKDYKNVVSSQMGVSALCVLPQGKLSNILKQSENPEHTEWKYERINDPELQKVAELLYDQLKEKIRNAIIETLKAPNTTESDVEGASEYLPEKSDEVKEKPADSFGRILKAPRVSKPKQQRTTEINTYEDDPEGNGVGVDLGERVDVPLEDLIHPSGHNDTDGGEKHVGDDSETGKRDPDGSEKFVRNKMTGTKYRFFCRDKSEGLYSLVFKAPKTADVQLELAVVDGAGHAESLMVLEALRFGNPLKIKKRKTVFFSIEEGDMVSLQLKISKKELVSVEVSLYAIW